MSFYMIRWTSFKCNRWSKAGVARRWCRDARNTHNTACNGDDRHPAQTFQCNALRSESLLRRMSRPSRIRKGSDSPRLPLYLCLITPNAGRLGCTRGPPISIDRITIDTSQPPPCGQYRATRPSTFACAYGALIITRRKAAARNN